jgi:hypothetical protein
MAIVLGSDERLSVGESRMSDNGQYRLDMQPDGNLVLYRTSDNAPLWASKTDGRGGTHAVMQSDGNLVVYGDAGAVWASQTAGNSSATLAVQDDGNVVIHQSGTPIWATDTAVRAPAAGSATEAVTAPAESAATDVAATYGTVVGSGQTRVYVTKEGDLLEDIASYFYGSSEQHQRIRDDNPAMVGWSGPLPAGVRLNVSEDPSRGDAVAGSSPT